MTRIEVYRGEKAHQKGLRKMMAQGWQVVGDVSSQPRSGCLRIVLLGFIGALVFKPKTQFTVTFTRSD